MKRPLNLTSPNNAKAVGLDVGLALLFFSFIASPGGSPAMIALTSLIGSRLVPVWASLMLVLGCFTIASIWSSTRARKPVIWLRLELVLSFAYASLLALLPVSLLLSDMIASASARVFLAVTLAYVMRGAQLSRELWKLHRCQATGETVTQEALADSTHRG